MLDPYASAVDLWTPGDERALPIAPWEGDQECEDSGTVPRRESSARFPAVLETYVVIRNYAFLS